MKLNIGATVKPFTQQREDFFIIMYRSELLRVWLSILDMESDGRQIFRVSYLQLALLNFRGGVPSGFYDSSHRLSGLWAVKSLLLSLLGQMVPSPLRVQTVFAAFSCLQSRRIDQIDGESFSALRHISVAEL